MAGVMCIAESPNSANRGMGFNEAPPIAIFIDQSERYTVRKPMSQSFDLAKRYNSGTKN